MKVQLLTASAIPPRKAHPTDLGYDLFCDNISIPQSNWIWNDSVPFCLERDTGVIRIHTGVAVELPSGYGALIKGRSSLALLGMTILGGVIDNGYIGELIICAANINMWPLPIARGAKIAQLVLIPYERFEPTIVDTLASSARGNAGFGSTGK